MANLPFTTSTLWYTDYFTRSLEHVHTHQTIPEVDCATSALLGISSIFSVFFNLMMLFEFWMKMRGKISVSFFIYFHILFGDILLSLLSAPLSVYVYAMARSEEKISRDSLIFIVSCNVSGFVYNVVSRVTVQLILLLTFDRWLSVAWPKFHRKYANRDRYHRLIGVLWFISIMSSSTPFFRGNQYKFDFHHLPICVWTFEETFKIQHYSKNLGLYMVLYIVYIIIPVTVPLLLIITFAATVIFLLSRIRQKDIKANKRTTRITYAVNTMCYVTGLHIASYTIWHLVISWNVLSVLGLVHLKTPINTMQLYLFTSYPLGAYFNSTMNPIFLYWRILKTKLSCFKLRTRKQFVSSQVNNVVKFKTTVRMLERSGSAVSAESARVQGIDIKFMKATSIRMSRQMGRALSRVSSASNLGRNIVKSFGSQKDKKKERVQFYAAPTCIVDPKPFCSVVIHHKKPQHNPASEQTVRSFVGPTFSTVASTEPSTSRVNYNPQSFITPMTPQVLTANNFIIPDNPTSAPVSLNISNENAFPLTPPIRNDTTASDESDNCPVMIFATPLVINTNATPSPVKAECFFVKPFVGNDTCSVRNVKTHGAIQVPSISERLTVQAAVGGNNTRT